MLCCMTAVCCCSLTACFRFNATKQLGWAAGKLSKGLAAGSRCVGRGGWRDFHSKTFISWLGGAAQRAVASEQHPKRAEIARATGDGLANLFKAMEEASNQLSEEAGGGATAAAARTASVPQAAGGSFYQGPEVVVGTPCDMEQQAGGGTARAASRAYARGVLRRG